MVIRPIPYHRIQEKSAVTSTKNNMLSVANLKFAPGETIVKEADYGISIYQIIKGEVEVFAGPEPDEASLATLGPGEIIGEMVFLAGYDTPRSATARAVTEVELEAWHPSRIKQEYDEMPFAVKHIANQVVARLKSTNRIIRELKDQRQKKTAPKKAARKQAKKRAFRKTVNVEVLYRPVNSAPDVKLWGKVKNLSLAGLRLFAKTDNADAHSHDAGEMFICSMFLPNGKRFNFRMKIQNSMVAPDNKSLSFGCQFVGLTESNKQVISAFVG
jgi:CRP-like cAMP-binding protein